MRNEESVDLGIYKYGTVRNVFRTLLVILLILYINALYAQNKFIAGVSTGIVSSQVSGDNYAGFNKFGIGAGIFLKTLFKEKFSGRIEMLYLDKGSRRTPHPDANDYRSYLLNLKYLEVPLLIGYKTSSVTIEAGPSFGALISSSESNELGDFIDSRPFSRTDLSLHLGALYPLSDNFFINWRISNSVLPIRKHLSDAGFRLNQGQYNTLLTLTLNYLFL
jgi:hypothetical protein